MATVGMLQLFDKARNVTIASRESRSASVNVADRSFQPFAETPAITVIGVKVNSRDEAQHTFLLAYGAS